ncbi:TPA: YSIRK-type signal peptide-containing protein, partial [Streptococcus equi subsp. zooepidemicus]|nr:YSIRK-type signal peptide-containing protein [Streptococcus equi subsp. zooepidemicus]
MFLRNNTNKQYSLRKLKKGTASVAVALAILGAGVTFGGASVAANNYDEVDLKGEIDRTDQILKDYDKVVEGYLKLSPHMSNLLSQRYRVSSYNDPSFTEQLKKWNDWAEENLGRVNGGNFRKALASKVEELLNERMKVEELKKEKSSLDNELKSQQQQKQELEDKLRQTDENLLSLSKYVNEQEDNINVLTEQIAHLKNEVAGREETINLLEDDIDN